MAEADVKESDEKLEAEEEMSEDDRLAAEWANMADDPIVELSAEEEEENQALLNQNEIDSLLGFEDDLMDLEGQNGVLAMVNSGLVNYDRLPMLEVIFDRLVRMVTTSLRNFTSDNVEVFLDGVSSVRYGDFVDSIPLPAMLSVFKAEELDNYGLLLVDSALIYSIVDVLLGGRKGSSSTRVEGRPYTTIERSLIERMINIVLNDLSSAFDPVSPVTFRFDRLETNPVFVAIARNNNACVHIKLRVEMESRGGQINFIIPYATLEPIRGLLLQMFMGEKFGRDSIWERHLAKEIWDVDVDIKAELDTRNVPLGQLLNLKKGDQIMLNAKVGDPVVVKSGNIPLFKAEMGQRSGHISVKIDKVLEQKKKTVMDEV